MRSLPIVAALVLLVPAVVCGQPAVQPEQLLAADSVVYFRFDGIDAHRRTYAQTAVGELMEGDLGNLVQYLMTVLKESLGPTLAKGQLLQGSPAEKLKFVRQGFDNLAQALA